MTSKILLLTLLACAPAMAVAQDLQYTSTTRIAAKGSFAPMMTMAGGANGVSARVSLKGSLMRVDMGEVSTILDAGNERVTMLDHTHQTVATSAFSQMTPPSADSSAKSVKVAVTVLAAPASTSVNGLLARRTTVLARVAARNPRAARANDVIVLNEVWSANAKIPGDAYARVARAAERFVGGESLMFGLMAQDPRAGAAMQKAAAAGAKVKGLPVRRTVIYGSVPTGRKFAPGMPLDTLLKVSTDITDVRSASLPASLFVVPSGYSTRK